jgi:hypothetical protein
MVGRNVLGLQLVGEHLLAKISALCLFCVMFISIAYLIISEICNDNVSICCLFFVHDTLFISFVMHHGSFLIHVVLSCLISN